MNSLDILRNELEAAAKVFGDDQNRGAILALRAVTNLIRREGMEHVSAPIPFYWLSDKIAHEALGGVGKNDFDAGRMGMAAGAVDLLKSEGNSLHEAARLVAREIDGMDAAQLIEFRKNLGKGRAKSGAIEARRDFVRYIGPMLEPHTSKDFRKKCILRGIGSVFCKKG